MKMWSLTRSLFSTVRIITRWSCSWSFPAAANLWQAWSAALTGAMDNFGERLLAMNVPAKAKKMWPQLAHTLDEIAPGGEPNPPSEMITSIVEAIYDDYAKVNFANYELRREDLDQLAAFAR